MKVLREEETKISKSRLSLYIGIILICVISVIAAFYVQFYTRIDIGEIVTGEESKYGNKTKEQISELESNFNNIFDNNIKNVSEQNKQKRKVEDREMIYSAYENVEEVEGSYSIDVNIPQININSNIVMKYNKEIKETFYGKVEDILKEKDENKNIIYTVEYTAEIQQDIFSLMIISNLKEGESAQRVILETYNYDLRNNKEISLEEILKIERIDKVEVQNIIDTKIKEEQRKVEDLNTLGYEKYSRDLESNMYDIENTSEYYLTGNELYIMYPYGNDTFTSEMDMVIL